MADAPTRIAIIGTSGAGKTTLGRELAQRLGVSFVECDAHSHRDNWRDASDEELAASLGAALVDAHGWVIDGTFQRRLGDFVSGRADVIVWLDLPLPTKLWRALRRSWRRWRAREVLWNGNRETWAGVFIGGDSLVWWAVRSHYRARREWPDKPHREKILRLRSDAEVAAWLERVAPATG